MGNGSVRWSELKKSAAKGGAQEKAQAQINAVVGKDRLPTMDDQPLLPFVDAIFRETLRYSPIAPLCELLCPLDNSHYYGKPEHRASAKHQRAHK